MSGTKLSALGVLTNLMIRLTLVSDKNYVPHLTDKGLSHR